MAAVEGLAALKIDRSRRKGVALGPWIVLVLIIVALVAGPAIFKQMQEVEVSVAPVVKSSGLQALPGKQSTELNAAGYVVADRQSTLASKFTGLLAKLNVVEAQHVKKDEIVAEMDHHELDADIRRSMAEEESAAVSIEHAKKLAAEAEAGLAASQAPLNTIDAEIKETEVVLADAKRRLERDTKVVAQNAMPSGNVDDRITEVRSAEARIATARQRRIEAQKHIGVVEAQVGTARNAIAVAEAQLRMVAARTKVLQAQLEDAFIHAPFDGIVIEKTAEAGEIVAPISIGGTMAKGSIVTLVDWTSLQAEVDVAEQYIARVKVGGRAAIGVDAFPNKVYPGKVLRILPRANRSKATVLVRVEFLKRDDTVLPEMGVRVKFLADDAPAGVETGEVHDKLLIPQEAVKGPKDAPFVWVVADNQARKRAITIGEPAGAAVEVKSGLALAESVVIRGADKLNGDIQKVRVKSEE